MAQDKKVKGGKLALVLVHGIGEAFVERDVAMARLSAFLKRECAAVLKPQDALARSCGASAVMASACTVFNSSASAALTMR